MNKGSVHNWIPDAEHPLGGRITTAVVPLANLDTDGDGIGRLWGQFVRVRNAGVLNRPDPLSGEPRPIPIGDALPDRSGDFIFDPGRGGGRLDKKPIKKPKYLTRYIQAAHFGEVNTYHYLDRIGSYVDGLLRELGARSLPRVIAVVNAHHGATEVSPGVRDGVLKRTTWMPFQGGHYRLPARRYTICEHQPISSDGEIHLGPGWRTTEHGALAETAGTRYRANASHNAGILYHEYGHHITRHTADFLANGTRPADRQSNRKTALEEGVCDYWAATMLGTPHVWAWHHRHEGGGGAVHLRSLISGKTMSDFDSSPGADPHANGTIFGAALWDLRCELERGNAGAVRLADLLVLRMLMILGSLGDPKARRRRIVRMRSDYGVALACLLRADEELQAGRNGGLIGRVFAARGILPAEPPQPVDRTGTAMPHAANNGAVYVPSALDKLRQRIGPAEVPDSDDLLASQVLEARLCNAGGPAFSLVAVGDIMLGGRARPLLAVHGDDYPFAAVLPLLRRAPIVLGNLEGPFATKASKQDRNFSYRVDPRLASSLARAGINVVTLANNHLTDCGRGGVLETLEALQKAGVEAIGAGVDRAGAHRPAILTAGPLRIGLLGYYWNRRTSATSTKPGSAMDMPENLERDIRALRKVVDRVVVTHHWGVPYLRDPGTEVRAKARLAIDCGADAVIGHHPHIIQAFEVHRDRPIFYSLGNFTFGSGNSRAESLLVGLRFEPERTVVQVFPIYVKNRDPRVAYQPRALAGPSAARLLERLASLSGDAAEALRIADGVATAEMAWSPVYAGAGSGRDG